MSTRASAWELTAYLKVRPVTGSPDFGELARAKIIETVFASVERFPSLREDLRGVRAQLERELGRAGRNIKSGRGGMMDVYFVTRYAQLRSKVDYPPERGTVALIEHLGREGCLDADLTADLGAGYAALRRIDHHLRLVGDRLAPRVPEDREALEELALATGYDSVADFDAALAEVNARVRAAFERVFAAD